MVTPYTIPDFSGSGINAFYFARYLNKENHRVTILTFNRNLKLAGRELKDGVSILRIPYFNRNLMTKILSLFIIFPVYIFQILRAQLVFIYGAHIIGYEGIIYISRILGKILIFRSLMLGSDDAETLLKNKNKCLRRLYRHLFRQLDLYFSINPVFTHRFQKQIGEGIQIMTGPQGVDTEIFHPVDGNQRMILRDKSGINPDTFIILSVGFLINRKGFKEVFEVLSRVTFDFRYILVGEYEFPKEHFLHKKNEEARIIREEGTDLLKEKLILTGGKARIGDYYQLADLVLINSKREGMPNTLLEAMACGKAILIRDLPGVNFIVQHFGNGIVYQDNMQMSEWLDKLRKEPELRYNLGREALAFVKEKATFRMAWEQINVTLKNPDA